MNRWPIPIPAQGTKRLKRAWKTLARLARAREGNTTVFMVMVFPVLIGFGLLSVDGAYLYYRHLLLQQTVQAAALAAGNKIPTYYDSGRQSNAGVVAAARAFANYNMPTATYGDMVPAGNVLLGNWNTTTSTFTSLAASGGTAPDAVQVSARNFASDGNPVQLFFGGFLGQATKNLQATAIAGQGSGQSFHTMIVSDLSGSFTPSMPQQRAVIDAIIDCITNYTASTTEFGIAGFTAHSSVQHPISPAKASKTLAKVDNNAMQACLPTLSAPQTNGNQIGNNGGINQALLPCWGTNQAAGLYAAIQALTTNAMLNTKRSIVIITDGVPVAFPYTAYVAMDGVYPTAARNTSPVCYIYCNDTQLWTMAVNQANIAKSLGIAVTTIYYSGSTPDAADQARYAAALATLSGNGGISLIAPTPAALTAHYAGFCSTIPSAVKAFR